eukprot:3851006-Prymnesium_polylepis.1
MEGGGFFRVGRFGRPEVSVADFVQAIVGRVEVRIRLDEQPTTGRGEGSTGRRVLMSNLQQEGERAARGGGC